MSTPRELTPEDQALAQRVLDMVMPRFAGRAHISDTVLTQLASELNQTSYQHHAVDPAYPLMKWRVHAVERSYLDGDGNTQFAHTGEIIARPIEIAGEEIEWPTL